MRTGHPQMRGGWLEDLITTETARQFADRSHESRRQNEAIRNAAVARLRSGEWTFAQLREHIHDEPAYARLRVGPTLNKVFGVRRGRQLLAELRIDEKKTFTTMQEGQWPRLIARLDGTWR